MEIKKTIKLKRMPMMDIESTIARGPKGGLVKLRLVNGAYRSGKSLFKKKKAKKRPDR